MAKYTIIEVVSGHNEYLVEADSPEEAMAKYNRDEAELVCDDVEVMESFIQ